MPFVVEVTEEEMGWRVQLLQFGRRAGDGSTTRDVEQEQLLCFEHILCTIGSEATTQWFWASFVGRQS